MTFNDDKLQTSAHTHEEERDHREPLSTIPLPQPFKSSIPNANLSIPSILDSPTYENKINLQTKKKNTKQNIC